MRPYTWRAAILKSGLKPTTRHVLLTLSCHVNDVGQSAYPSTKLLAEETGLSERAVITHLHEASEAGWLRICKHGFGGQKWARNEYYPAMPAVEFDDDGSDGAAYLKFEQHAASTILNNAVAAGHIHKESCAICGAQDTEGHHRDYSKPLEVVWLCDSHRLVLQKGTERGSAPPPKALNVVPKGTERHAQGTEPNSKKALNVVQSNSPVELSKELSKEIKKRGHAASTDFSALDELLASGVDHQTASDWLTLRKAKRAVVTKTALAMVVRESASAGLGLGDALQICCERGWAGFKADWITQQSAGIAPRGGKNDRSGAAAAVFGNQTDVPGELIDVN